MSTFDLVLETDQQILEEWGNAKDIGTGSVGAQRGGQGRLPRGGKTAMSWQSDSHIPCAFLAKRQSEFPQRVRVSPERQGSSDSLANRRQI